MNKKIHNRKDLRLKRFDYSTPGGYFVTICTANQRQTLGCVSKHDVELTRLGELVERVWLELPDLFSHCDLMEHVVMPNHLHGIVLLNQTELVNQNGGSGTTQNSLGSLIQSYKSRVTRLARKQGIWSGTLWQRGYHDHVIRNDGDLAKIQEYIVNNPLKLHFDKENPQRNKGAKPGFAPTRDGTNV